MKRFPHFPNIFLFLDRQKKKEREKERKKSQRKIGRCWGSGEKWCIRLWRTGTYSFPLILASGGNVGEVGGGESPSAYGQREVPTWPKERLAISMGGMWPCDGQKRKEPTSLAIAWPKGKRLRWPSHGQKERPPTWPKGATPLTGHPLAKKAPQIGLWPQIALPSPTGAKGWGDWPPMAKRVGVT